MEITTLDDIKRQAAEEDAAQNAKTDGDQQELANAANQQEEVEESEELETETESESDSDNVTDEESEEVESWMVGDEQTSQDSEEETASNTVPVKKHVKVKHKLQAKVNERDEEIAHLKQEIEKLKGNSIPHPNSGVKQVKRPSAKDYTNEYGEFDADKFDLDMEAWEQSKTKASQAEAQEAQSKQQQEKQIDNHYQQAQALVDSGIIEAEAFANCDKSIRQALDNAVPGQGDALADFLITHVNMVTDEPAKLWYKLGVSQNTLNEVLQAYQNDQTGAAGIAKLAKLSNTIKNPVKRRSQAPKPSKNLSGGDMKSESTDVSSLKRKMKTAEKNGDLQTYFNLRQEARNKGFDVSNW